MKTYTQKEAIKIRDDRERRLGTIDTTYIVDRVARGKWAVIRTQRLSGLRRAWERLHDSAR